MRKVAFLFVLVGTLTVSAGCSRGTPGGKTDPAKDTPAKPGVTGPADGTFTLDVPNLAVKLKQGETKATSIGINRGKNFSDDVKLGLSTTGKGVSFDPASPTIKAGETEAKFNVKATEDAAIGDHTVEVTGTPAAGAAGTHKFTVTVNQK